MTNVVVTGASGFCGEAMVSFLRKRGVSVLTIEHQHFYGDRGGGIPSGPVVAKKIGDFCPGVVFHFAGRSHLEDGALLFEANVLTTLALFGALRILKISPVVVLCGSAAEYGPEAQFAVPISEDFEERPNDTYGKSKLAQTTLGRLMRDDFPVVISRPFNLVGPRMPTRLALGNYLAQIKESMAEKYCKMQVRDLASSRDFVYIDDAIRAWWDLARLPGAWGQTVNLCSGVPTTVAELVEMLKDASPIVIETIIDANIPQTSRGSVFYGNPSKLKNLIGWTPRPLDAEIMTEIVSSHIKAP